MKVFDHGIDPAQIAPLQHWQMVGSFREATLVRQDVPHEYGILAVLAECRPIVSNSVIKRNPSSFDLLPQRDRGHRFGPRKERKERLLVHERRGLRVCQTLDEVQHEPTVLVSGERTPWEES